MKLTPYFPLETPPANPGVYLTLRHNSTEPTYWRAFDGKDWYYGLSGAYPSPDYNQALGKGVVRPAILTFQWCGLAKNPVKEL